MSKPQYETRVMQTPLALETRDDGTRTVVGYPIVFNSLSHNLGGFKELIRPEAIKRTLESEQDVRAYVEHDARQKLGRGVKAEIDLPATTVGNDLATGLSRQDYDGMSFRFYKLRDKWTVKGEERVREVLDMVFDEVSVVGDPAYPDTSVALRSMAEAFESELSEKEKKLAVMRMELRIAELD
jgi:HK97 family phage prohead protease